MTKYQVSYNMPGCIPDEPPYIHDDFEDAKEEVIWYIENYIEALSDPKLIRKYEESLHDVREYWKEENVPLSVRIGAYNAHIEKADDISEEEE